MATVDTTAPAAAPTYRLTLESYPPARKVTVINIVRDITGLGLKEAKDLVESVPAVVKEFDDEGAADLAHGALADCVAECTLVVIGAEADVNGAADDLPSREVLERVIDKQRQKLWQVGGIIRTTARMLENAGNEIDGKLDESDAGDAQLALEGAFAILNDASGALEVASLIEAAEAEGGAS